MANERMNGNEQVNEDVQPDGNGQVNEGTQPDGNGRMNGDVQIAADLDIHMAGRPYRESGKERQKWRWRKRGRR